ncbi:HNH endonuclease signature motif containing protein [Microbacterium abyssi]|uniref:HNH endonuclease signature motif containing protein n=1 Tax=Microbacterium abyssi TaxID=2782166 RepID=UPI001887E7A6|nr:HNH endonuclease signature motif containing protein [Microbacterium sp. A18JL241]
MATFTDVAALIPTLCGRLVDGADADLARASMMLMTDADVVKILEETAALAKQVEQIQVLAAGVVALRSNRERGHSGLSQSRGHRSAAALIQDVTGSTKADANRKVRVGEALVDEPSATQPAGDEHANGGRPTEGPWYQPLRDALRDSRLTSSQFDAIRRGLGDPPEIGDDASGDATDAEARAQAHEEARAAWRQASEHLIGEAAERTVEELWQAARTVRDLLDPEGAEARFLERFEKRSFRTYRGQDGQKRASMTLDDEGDLFIETLLAAAMRPRRGGPRFVDADEKERAASLADDPRTNDQLSYDLVLDVLRAGMLADSETVFGTRQAGVRLVQVMDADGNAEHVVHSEDHLVSVPGAVAEQHMCDSGFVPVTVDACGNPLDVGREQRLFTPKQRIGLAIRDGGCRWLGCDRPASYCEAHHIDEWKRDQGRTDIDRGILLCRYHHMTLHHGEWRITRRGKDDFVLHHRSGETYAMRPRAALSYAWGGIDPPPKRFRPAA